MTVVSVFTSCPTLSSSAYLPQDIQVLTIPLQVWRTLRVPEVWGSRILWHSAYEGCQVVSPTHRSPLSRRKYSLYSFLLEAESTAGPQCARKDCFNEKFQRHRRESNPRPSGLKRSASTNYATAYMRVLGFRIILRINSNKKWLCNKDAAHFLCGRISIVENYLDDLQLSNYLLTLSSWSVSPL
jgi:hypothetical protein